jgi:hypothetical protein
VWQQKFGGSHSEGSRPGSTALPPTAEAHTTTQLASLQLSAALGSDEEEGYKGDVAIDTDGEDDDSDDEDGGIFFGPSRGKRRVDSVSVIELSRRHVRRGTGGSARTRRSGSSGTLKKVGKGDRGLEKGTDFFRRRSASADTTPNFADEGDRTLTSNTDVEH